MPTKPRPEQHAEPGPAESQQSGALIGRNVLRALGQPGDLFRVQVQRLWEDCYRVNVFVGPDAASAKVAHSYFLQADGTGAILACTPDITRQY
jgi:hypothetical protein